MTTFKLGKHPARFDARVPRLEKHLAKAALPAPPPKKDWGAAAKIAAGAWGMMLNDNLGDCVAAEKGHAVELWTALTGSHKKVVLPDAAVLAFYETQGYVPGDPSTDNGMDMLTAAQTFQSVGIGGHRISAFASVPAGANFSPPTWQATVNLFGVLAMGIQLPAAWQSRRKPGDVWDVGPNGSTTGAYAPGSWGGHDVPVIGYDATQQLFEFVTWGQVQYITEAAVRAYSDEAYAYLSPDWFYNGTAPNLYRLGQLEADLQLESAKALPKINWPGLLAWARRMLVKFGPVAVPLVEAAVENLPLSPAQLAVLDALIEQVLGSPHKATLVSETTRGF
jgi:hypothetical protein